MESEIIPTSEFSHALDPNRCVATVARRWTTRTNTVFIDAKTRGMAVPLAILSSGVISVQNWQFETHTPSLDLGGAKGILSCYGLPAPTDGARVSEGVGDNAISFE